MTATGYAPSGRLAEFVELLWIVDDHRPAHEEDCVLPSGRSQLLVDLGETPRFPDGVDALFTGLSTEPVVVPTEAQRSLIGVTFRANGLAAFVRLPVAELTDERVEAESLWTGTRDLCSKLRDCSSPEATLLLLERELVRRLDEDHPHPAIERALRSIDADPNSSIDRVRASTGLSHRRFVELFKREVGVTPKRYARVRRFQQAVAAIGDAGGTGTTGIDWASVALAAGYYDQPHFVNEFREFTGMSPTVYAARYREHRNHVASIDS